jgi:hypothetical protein
MAGRPRQTLTRPEHAELTRLLARTEAAEEKLADARKALAEAAARIEKPEAVARALGVTRGTITYWMKTQL